MWRLCQTKSLVIFSPFVAATYTISTRIPWRPLLGVIALLLATAALFHHHTVQQQSSNNDTLDPSTRKTLTTLTQRIGATDQRQIRQLEIPRWIADYTRWHAQALAEPDRHQFLVYSCTGGACGGIGDRVRGMLSLFYVAMASQRVFLIQYTKPYPLNDTLIEGSVHWSFPVPGGRKSWIRSIDKNDSRIVEPQRISSKNARQKRILYAQYNYFSDQLLWKSTAMRQYLSKYRLTANLNTPPPQLFKWAFHTLFRKSPGVQQRIEQLRSQLVPDQAPYVGMHVRTGNGTTWGDVQRHSMSDVERFLQCARRMQRIIQADVNPLLAHPPIIFVASDNAAIKQHCRAMESSVRTAETVIYQVDRSSGERRAREGNMDAWTEMFMLAEANCVIASESRFSQVAVAISVREPAGGRCWAFFNECDEGTIEGNLLAPGSERPLGYIRRV